MKMLILYFKPERTLLFSGDPGLNELENMTLVGNGRMLVDEEMRVRTVKSWVSWILPTTEFD
ncbi:uncharacterized protein N7500_007944 [Penicillium coprophilum]|uniref:uncharacterized protein n=1 Tax=Penicillium coprophilum TaxID=36646 RepID=UPI0023A2E9B2|nr:uncharacterized protein N7500_007944 [Penicillium coprophilum]KAJ5158293.1 hypothetical protein N7500_007944 [Penicillium coprophilum]